MSHKCFPSFQEFSSFQEGARRFEKAMRGIPDRVPMCAQMHEFAKQVSFLFLPLAIVLLLGFPALAPDVFRNLQDTPETSFWKYLEAIHSRLSVIFVRYWVNRIDFLSR
jgi:hypothetical protein